MLSGISVLKTPPKNAQAASPAGDHRLGRLLERQPHEAVPADTRREDQRVHHAVAARRRVADQAHPTEVDLQLVARLAVVDAHR
ncbi:MAG TPA: hypothetical protein VFI47_00510 [Acidimicrobiales bacterium]|nr:hypothetical protein [Acidimicrobiales bacterium]